MTYLIVLIASVLMFSVLLFWRIFPFVVFAVVGTVLVRSWRQRERA